MKETFTGRVRAAAKALGQGGRTFTNAALSERAVIQTRKDQKRLNNAIKDMAKAGEIMRAARGVYQYVEKKKDGPSTYEVMWRVIRARRAGTLDDLVELAGAGRKYVEEYLAMLQKRGIVRRLKGSGRWQLVKDQVEPPRNDEAAAKQRRLRAEKKARALDAIDRAFVALSEARMAVAEMEEG